MTEYDLAWITVILWIQYFIARNNIQIYILKNPGKFSLVFCIKQQQQRNPRISKQQGGLNFKGQ